MSEAVISNRQLAIGQRWEDLRVSSIFMGRSRNGNRTIHHAQVLPIAYCLLPIARSRTAIPCTVTHLYTSVTTLPLVESGLIIVGRAIGRWAETVANRGFGLAAHCSFHEGMCIQ